MIGKFICKSSILLITSMYSIITFAGYDNLTAQKIQQALDNYRIHNNIGAMGVSITSSDKKNPFHYNAVSGTLSKTNTKPIEKSSLFQIGSITKSYTAALLLHLEEKPDVYGFNVDQPLQKWLPEYPQWGNITIRQLLNHTSGIYNYVDTLLPEVKKNPEKSWSNKELVEIAAQHPAYFEVGKGFHYSNTNYILADMVYRKVTRQSFIDSLRTFIIDAGLNDTYYYPGTFPQNIQKNIVHGYTQDNQDITDNNISWSSAAGAMLSTAQDTDRWLRRLLLSNKVLKTDQLKEMQTTVCQTADTANGCTFAGEPSQNPNAATYGLGLMHYKDVWWHDGSMEGYASIVLYYAPQKISVAIVANKLNESSQPDFSALRQELAEILVGKADAFQVA